jgi:hypothetical protein
VLCADGDRRGSVKAGRIGWFTQECRDQGHYQRRLPQRISVILLIWAILTARLAGRRTLPAIPLMVQLHRRIT